MMKLGVENDIALLNYLSSVSLSATDKVISSPSPSRPGETELPIIPALYAPAPHIPSAFASVRRG